MKLCNRARENDKSTIIRSVLSDILLAEKARGSSRESSPSDLKAILLKAIDSRKSSAAAYTEAQRDDLAEGELKEASYLESLMPPDLSDQTYQSLLKQALEDTKLAPGSGLKGMRVVLERIQELSKGEALSSKATSICRAALTP